MKKYWMLEDASTVAKHMDQVHGGWQKWSSNPIMQAWVRNIVAYYSAILEPEAWDTSLSFDGEEGELVKMLIPEARTLTRQFVALITKQRMAFQCTARTTGSDVIQETRLGNALTSQIIDDQRLDAKAERLAEMACVLGNAFLKSTWRTDKGSPKVADGNGGVIYDGDLEISIHSPLDVIFDYSLEDWENNDIVEVKTKKSRWSLIAQHPDLEDEILKIASCKEWAGTRSSSEAMSVFDEDLIYCYELYHKPTPAMPQGRMIMYSNHKTIYFDGENRYGCIPVEPCKPEPVIGTGLGYPMFSNLLPAQEMMDHDFSTIATNHSAFGVQNVSVARGAGISVQSLNGMNFISYTPQNVPGGGKPEAMQLTASSPESFKFIDILRDRLVGLSNLNSALRGQPPAGVTSGAAIATLTSNAMEFMTSFSKAYTGCLERTMMHGINAYRKFATTERLVRMAGKQFQSFSKAFVGSDLDPIQAVKMTVSNPLMMTIAGRTDIAEKAMKFGLVKNMQEYISILEGSPLQDLYKTELSENDLIDSENDALLEGKSVKALSSDDHPAHVRAHIGLLNDVSVRLNNEMANGILEHAWEHVRLAKETDPFFLAMVRTGKMPEGGAPSSELGDSEAGASVLEGPGEPAQPAQPADDMLGR